MFYSVHSSQQPKSHLIWIVLFGLMGKQVLPWAESLIVEYKHSPSGNTSYLSCESLVVLNKLLCVCLPKYLCCKYFTSLVQDLFKSICVTLGMMQRSHSQIWRNLGVILRTCIGINDLNVVSLISTLFVTESTALAKPPFSNGFIISLCRSLQKSPLKFWKHFIYIWFWFLKTDNIDWYAWYLDIGMRKYPFHNLLSQ